MNAFTAEYLARLELWGLLASLAQGALVLLSWHAWQRAALGASVRHRLACAHFAALGVLPALTLVILQATVAGMAGQQPHGAMRRYRPDRGPPQPRRSLRRRHEQRRLDQPGAVAICH